MQTLRYIHRIVTLTIVAFTLYLGVTGTLIQIVDLKTILGNAPALDPDMQAIRESGNGPGGFEVLRAEDWTAPSLPTDVAPARMLATVMQGARAALGPAADFRFVELRMDKGVAVGRVRTADNKQFAFDARSGAALGELPRRQGGMGQPPSVRNQMKWLHRMTTFGDWALFINVIVGVGLLAMIVTGVWIWGKLYLGRVKLDRANPFWKAGGWWKTLHRATSIVCAVFLCVVSLSGLWLAVESAGFAIYNATHSSVNAQGRRVAGAMGFDPSSRLDDATLPGMLAKTLNAYGISELDGSARIIRLRNYAGIPQGVVVTGEAAPRQLVYNATTGERMGLTEPGYPPTGFPFGWNAHQIAKKVHRGDYFGLTGRWMDLISGFALIYLSVSGGVIYYDLWKKRRAAGRKGLVWK